ncbi:hypothetical protein Vretimale_17021 [Volvox reticuliferus]|uniref:Uncharacterized protein n=1 Tax=Volvox reticuliferus TaxID=1737510 RepID=A0A8J4LXE3_9CHLO|nr:hypothetical protein Vretimale_17021 [Volvox reticuliferus]
MAASVRPLNGIFQISQCSRSAHTSSRRIHVIRGNKTLIAATAAFYSWHHIEINDDVAPIDWDSPGEITPDSSITPAWDYSHLDVEAVEANFSDAATYRIIVLKFPGCPSNIKELRSFRDNVTRKLAPTIAHGRARAFAERTLLFAGTVSNDRPGEFSFIDGHAASWLKPHPIQQAVCPAPAAILSSPVDSEGRCTLEVVDPRDLLPLHGAPGHQEVQSQRERVVPARSSSNDLLISDVANAVREPNVSNRIKRGSRRRRGTGRNLLADAGRHGYVKATAAGSDGSGRYPAE